MDNKLIQSLMQLGLGAFIAVGGALISLILYIWSERKKQIDKEQDTQAEFNSTLKDELGELKTQNLRLEDGLQSVNQTMSGLQRWLVQNEKDHKIMEKDIVEVKTDIKNIQNKI